MKYWEIIADNLKKRGWSLGWVSAVDSQGRTIWIVDAHRGDGKRFIVHADEKLTAFVEFESAICACDNFSWHGGKIFQNSTPSTALESAGGLFPPLGSSPPPGPQPESPRAGKKKGRIMNPLIQARKTTQLFLVLLVFLGLLPMAQALLPPPPPDGGYPGDNTAEGDDALFSLTTGVSNTAIGFEALFSNTMGSANTAIGLQALFSNTTGAANTATGQVALFSNTFGGGNTATGSAALFSNTFGSLSDSRVFSGTERRLLKWAVLNGSNAASGKVPV